MGHEASERCEEDDLCADILARRLRGETPDVDESASVCGGAERSQFFDPACDWAPERDFELCTQVDAFDFVLRRCDRDLRPPSCAR